MTTRMTCWIRGLWGLVAIALVDPASGGSPPMARGGDDPIREVAELLDGRRVTGRLSAGSGGAIAFEPESGGGSIPLDRLGRVERSAEGQRTLGNPEAPPFLLSLGLDERLSGQLVSVDEQAVRLTLGGTECEVVADRGGVASLAQRPGEARVFADGFEGEEPDRDRWETRRGIEIGTSPDADGPILMLSPSAAEARLRLPEPIDAGRFELSFFWEDRRYAGLRWFVDLIFAGRSGEEVTRVVLGWTDPFPSVESRGGPEIVVQPLILEPGWHRLSARFGPDRTLLAIDGDELGRGNGPRGSLVAVRLSSTAARDAEPAGDLAAKVDDLLAIRSFEPTTSPDFDPKQDEIRMVTGDQIWGVLRSADGDGVEIEVLDRPFEAPWSQVAGLYFRRMAGRAEPIEGTFVRVDWDVGDPESRPDRIEGALVGLDDAELRVATPFAGTIAVPRGRLRRLDVLGRGRRLVIDPFARHLGDQLMPDFDPPMPDDDRLEVRFSLDAIPEGPAELVIDAVHVEGEFEGGRFAEDLRAGFLRTNLLLNGRGFDYLNRHVRDANRTPSRFRIALPSGLLREGENVLTFEQLGREKETEYRDDLGLLRIALEWLEVDDDAP